MFFIVMHFKNFTCSNTNPHLLEMKTVYTTSYYVQWRLTLKSLSTSGNIPHGPSQLACPRPSPLHTLPHLRKQPHHLHGSGSSFPWLILNVFPMSKCDLCGSLVRGGKCSHWGKKKSVIKVRNRAVLYHTKIQKEDCSDAYSFQIYLEYKQTSDVKIDVH